MTKEQKARLGPVTILFALLGAGLFWLSPVLGGAVLFGLFASLSMTLRFLGEALKLMSYGNGVTNSVLEGTLKNLRTLNEEALSRNLEDVDPPTQTRQ